MNKSVRFLSIITISALAFLLLNVIGKENIPFLKNVSESYEIKAVKIPAYLELAGERVPIERADVREKMDRELLVNTYWQSNGLLVIKRANKIFPILEPLLAKHGLPDDFKYLAVAESALLVNNPSHARASGLWHFLPSTAREKRFKLEVNKNVDERYNIEKSTAAAAIYLKRAKEKFGSWTLAAASYNCGMGRVSERLRNQDVTSYYDALLPDETERYVFRILALKEVMSNPEKYGFVFDQEDLYQPEETYTVKVDTAITNIASFAKGFGITYKELKRHNPWLREGKLNNKSRKLYEIKIPR
ncbi:MULTISPECIES: lytic transglycosylase domain-containing protein [Tenacibaculum]|uniref:lytic transglycosylase domain-containing protein n=1 Tax=Tenacibaculum TaxID=104267 RepID=UPI001F0AA2E3|nr:MULTISPECIES: lytic transglycosylase domain-containing protein [Tenacibaculum]MCH3883205.1 lytic transglycosylase domain-containing protein [Tenacibaculum aquimarinum]MCH3885390.1 lytic transglycosylase domain-containing protein [Tenacibaculum aquimarinum]MDO6600950.1 lytic transglycosylase domain-containing protein [Tenacibaculum sp. 1_MG-2023]